MAINKQYLVSFLATIQGDRAVTGGLKRIELQTKKTGKQAPKMALSFDQAMGKIMKRALLTIPVWLLMRTVMMGVIRTVGDVVRAHFDLEEQLARIRTVMQAEGDELEGSMMSIKRQIMDMSAKTRIPIKELAEGFYFLKTASLDTEEAMSAFTATVSLSVGTGNKMAESARAVAGIYNTMGKHLGDNLTIQEKMIKIADTLAYVYATQDVQLSELIASYTKLAPYMTGLTDSFEDMMVTLGFLNTRLLRAGRTGRLTGRAILQLTKNASQLAEIFGITFDPNKPLPFLDTMRKINKTMDKGTKLTVKQSEALRQVFATRAGTPTRLLLESFEALEETLAKSGKGIAGFAKEMESIRMGTVPAQAERMKNIFALLFEEFISGVYATGDLASAMERLNDVMSSERIVWRRTGQMIGWVGELLGRQLATWNALLHLNRDEFFNMPQIRLFSTYLKEQEKQIKKITKLREEQDKKREKIKEGDTIRLSRAKKYNETISHSTKLLKTMGVHSLDIARYTLEKVRASINFKTNEEAIIAIQKAKNNLIREEEKYRREIVDTFQKAEISMLQAMGVSEFQILNAKERQLEIDRESIGNSEYMLRLDDLRIKKALALKRTQRKEENLIMEFEKASPGEKERIRRVFELKEMDPDILAGRYRDIFDKQIIRDYWRYFSDEARTAITDLAGEQNRLLRSSGMPMDRSKQLLSKAGRELGRAGFKAPKALKESLKIPDFDIVNNFGNITIQLPLDSLDRMAEKVSRDLEEKLKNDETLAKLLAQALRPYI